MTFTKMILGSGSYIVETFVRESMIICQKECPGCRDDMKSAVLHLHHQLSLLEKFKKYFEQIRGNISSKIPTYYSQFESKLPHSDDLTKD